MRKTRYQAAQISELWRHYLYRSPLAPCASKLRQTGGNRRRPPRIRDLAKHLDHAKKGVVAARYYDIPAEALEQIANNREAPGP